MVEVKQEVRQFYDQIGWSLVGEDIYQNARYEDLRPVSREYIHRCHLRVSHHLSPSGRYLLDAGSGPIQYPEYLEYSRGYQYRVCADISITALKEARRRMQLLPVDDAKGLFVVADIANLPFKRDVFDGVVSLHTIHHLPEDEHLQAYQELHRLLTPGKNGVVVNGWPSSPLMERFESLVRLSNRLRHMINRLLGRVKPASKGSDELGKEDRASTPRQPKGTFTSRHDVAWVKTVVGAQMPLEILVWRSASVRFLRAVIFPWLGGRYWLRLLYRQEERYPHEYGEKGQYPLIVIQKSSTPDESGPG
jgi:SAM-dependent methyltransferase